MSCPDIVPGDPVPSDTTITRHSDGQETIIVADGREMLTGESREVFGRPPHRIAIRYLTPEERHAPLNLSTLKVPDAREAEVPSAPPPVEASHGLEEKRIADLVTALIPLDGAEVTPLGQSVFALVIGEVAGERTRCIKLVGEVIASAQRAAHQATGIAQAAQLKGDMQMAQQAHQGATQAQILTMALMAISNTLSIPPGVCRTCAGTKLMPSPIARNQMTTCTACAQAPQKDETAS